VDLVFNDIAPSNGVIEIRFTSARTSINGQSVRGEAFVQALEIGLGEGGKAATPISVPAAPATGNLLLNPGFEETVAGLLGGSGVNALLAEWNCQFLGPSQSYIWQEADYVQHPDWGLPEVHAGKGAIRTHTDAQGHTQIYQDVEIGPQRQCTASVWVRAVDLHGKGFGYHTNDSAGLIICELDDRGQFLRPHPKVELKTAVPYTQLKCDFRTTAATAQVRFILDTVIHCPYAEGHVTYDDCALSTPQD
jgi:hypothetical protein